MLRHANVASRIFAINFSTEVTFPIVDNMLISLNQPFLWDRGETTHIAYPVPDSSTKRDDGGWGMHKR